MITRLIMFLFCLALIFREGDGKASRIISANWVRDEDISRLLMSLPNWTNLQVKNNAKEVTSSRANTCSKSVK